MIGKKYNAQMGNYLAKLAQAQTNISASAKPLTNADRIRAMSDEELADWFSSIAEEAVKSGGKIKSSCWLDWLKQEVNNNSKT